MASRLRVDEILPSVGNNIAIGTAIGSVSFANATYTVGTGASVFSPTTNTLAFGTNNTEKLRITSSGNIGIGTDNPATKLEVYGTTISTSASVNGTGRYRGFEIYDNGTRTSYHQDDDTDNAVRLFTTRNNLIFGTGDTEAARFNSSGNLAFPSGQGIDFSATGGPTNGTDSSELLDDYEEGTWTPGTASGNNTLSNASAKYIKIGNLCWFSIQAQLSTTATPASGHIYNLPYLAVTSHAGAYPIRNADNILSSFNGAAYIDGSIIYVQNSAGTGSAAAKANLSNVDFAITGCYQVR